MSEDMSGKQIAEVLKFLAQRVQDALDEGQDVVKELRIVANDLEKNK